MPVAQHQGVQLRRIDAEHLDVVVDRLRGIAEVDQHAASFRPEGGFNVERKAPLVLRHAPRRLARRRLLPALHIHSRERAGRLEEVKVGIGDHRHRQPVDLGRRAAQRRRSIRFNPGEHTVRQAHTRAHGGHEASRGLASEVAVHWSSPFSSGAYCGAERFRQPARATQSLAGADTSRASARDMLLASTCNKAFRRQPHKCTLGITALGSERSLSGGDMQRVAELSPRDEGY